MGLFEWLRELLSGPSDDPEPGPRRDRSAPGPAPHRPAAPRPSSSAGRDAEVDASAVDGDARRTRARARLDGDRVARDVSAYEGRTGEGLKAELRERPLPWFDAHNWRRERIPPVDDRRTRLIDEGMIGAGLISAEDLAELHATGAEYDRLRPRQDEALRIADAGLAADKAERARIKAEKRASASQRREQRRREIDRRRREDIIYVGRGVSAPLGRRDCDTARLAKHRLPQLDTPAALASFLELEPPALRHLCFHDEALRRTHYVRFAVPKPGGGERLLAAPLPRLAAAQRRVLRELLDRIPAHEAAHGFVKGRSTVTNARIHVGAETLVCLDLTDFFPTITWPRVDGLFRSLGFSPATARLLTLLCTEAPRREVRLDGEPWQVALGPRALPQGAPTSPAISNLVARGLDRRLNGLATSLGWRYSRYADDLAFSRATPGGPTPRGPTPRDAGSNTDSRDVGRLLTAIRKICLDEGFPVNETKTRVQRRSAAQTVTGLVVNDRVGVPRKLVRRLRAILHGAKSTGLAAQNRESHPHFEAWLEGMIAYIAMVKPEQAARLREALEALPERR